MKPSYRVAVGVVACLATFVVASIILIPTQQAPAQLRHSSGQSLSEMVRFADCVRRRRPAPDPVISPGTVLPMPCLMV